MNSTDQQLTSATSRHHLSMVANGESSRLVDGTILFADVSGFTALSERLERRGREGAELMSNLLAAIFAPMLDLAAARGGDLLGYGGDALLLLFTGDRHGEQAIATAAELLEVLRRRTPAHRAVGRAALTMSMGAESGPIALFAAGQEITQLMVAGPTLDAALRAESDAVGGELLLGPNLAASASRFGTPTVPPCVDVATRPDADELAARALSPALASYFRADGRSGEHRPVTALFLKHVVDVDVRSPASMERVAQRLAHFTSTVVDLCEQHGLSLIAPDALVGAVKFSIVGGAPVAHGDSVDAAMSFALDLLEELGDDVSIGINQGTVYCGEITGSTRRVYAVLGDAMNLAARVMSKAERGTALVEVATAAQGRLPRILRPIDPFAAKGKSLPVEAFRLLPGRPPLSVDTAEILGREDERHLLDTAWAATKAGESTTVGIVAPPGLGKSALMAAWLAGSDPSATVRVSGGRLGRLTPLYALSVAVRDHFGLSDATDEEVLASLDLLIEERAPSQLRWRDLVALAFGVAVGDSASELDERVRAERLREGVAALLASADRPSIVVAVDDAHLLDDATEAVLAHVSVNAPGAVFMISAVRSDESSALVEAAGQRLVLGPLTDEVARRIVRSHAPNPLPVERIERIVARAEGNPLFLSALARAGATDSLPGTVEEAIRRELDRLAPTVRRTLGKLAALGSASTVESVKAVIGDDAARSLTSLGVDEFVQIDARQVVFRHPLRREVAYAAMPFGDRRAAHARALDHLLSVDEPPPSLVALHAYHSREDAETWRWARRAAAEPAAGLAPGTAAEHLEWAVAAARRLRSVSTVELAAALEELGDAYEATGRFVDAERSFRSAMRIDTDLDRTVRRVCRVARQCEHQGQLSRGLRWARRGQRSAEHAAVTTRALPVRSETALRFRGGDLVGALRANESAMELALAADDRAMLVQTHRMAGTVKELTGHDGVIDLRRSLELAVELGDDQSAAWAHNNLGAALYDRGQWAESADRYRSYYEVATRLGDTLEAATASNNLAEILSDQGHWAGAERLFADALDVFDGAGYRIGRAVALGNLSRVHRRSGSFERAATELRAASDEFRHIGADDFLIEMTVRGIELELSTDGAAAIDATASHRPTAIPVLDAGPTGIALRRLTAVVALRSGDVETARRELLAARAAAIDADYRYEGALVTEVLVRCGLDSSAAMHADLVARFEELAIIDSGQKSFLDTADRQPS